MALDIGANTAVTVGNGRTLASASFRWTHAFERVATLPGSSYVELNFGRMPKTPLPRWPKRQYGRGSILSRDVP